MKLEEHTAINSEITVFPYKNHNMEMPISKEFDFQITSNFHISIVRILKKFQ
jgi:hypothetical protein